VVTLLLAALLSPPLQSSPLGSHSYARARPQLLHLCLYAHHVALHAPAVGGVVFGGHAHRVLVALLQPLRTTDPLAPSSRAGPS